MPLRVLDREISDVDELVIQGNPKLGNVALTISKIFENLVNRIEAFPRMAVLYFEPDHAGRPLEDTFSMLIVKTDGIVFIDKGDFDRNRFNNSI